MTLEIQKTVVVGEESNSIHRSAQHYSRCQPAHPNHRPQRRPHHQQLQHHVTRTIRTILMPAAAIDSLSSSPSSSPSIPRTTLQRRRSRPRREHAVVDPGAGSWGGQRAPGGVGDESPMSTSDLPPDEVHTFPGICDDHPPDDLSTIALAPFTDDTSVQPEQMQTDHSFPRGVLAVAEPQLERAFPTFTTASNMGGYPSSPTRSVLLPTDLSNLPPGGGAPLATTSAGEAGIVLKQEDPVSPTDFAIAGTSSSSPGGTFPVSSQCSTGWGQSMSATPSPSSPVIPLTAMELICKDEPSSSSDGEFKATSGPSTSSGKPRSSSSFSKTLDRRRVSDEDSDEDTNDEDLTPDERVRLDRRRLSNRVAAQKCRQRQRQHHRGLMKEVQDWECKNTGLNYEVRQLQKTLRQMLKEVEEHESRCTTVPPVLTPEEKMGYHKVLDDVAATQSNVKGTGKSSK